MPMAEDNTLRHCDKEVDKRWEGKAKETETKTETETEKEKHEPLKAKQSKLEITAEVGWIRGERAEVRWGGDWRSLEGKAQRRKTHRERESESLLIEQ